MKAFLPSLDLINSNIAEVKVHGPDYMGMDKDEALNDFVLRIQHYEECYVPIDQPDADGCRGSERLLSYMKILNAGERFVINRTSGNLQSRIGYWLMNIHITPRSIYLTRHGESMMNVEGKIGGNSELSPNGAIYASKLADYFEENEIEDLRVWTSWFRRTIQTAAGIQVRYRNQ